MADFALAPALSSAGSGRLSLLFSPLAGRFIGLGRGLPEAEKWPPGGVSMGAKTFVSEMAFFCAHDFWGFFVSGQIRKRAIRTDFRCAADPHIGSQL